MDATESFSKRLMNLRKERGLSQTELGTMIDRTKYTISAYERGIAQPTFEVLVELSQVLDVDINYLLGNTDERRPAPHMTEEEQDRLATAEYSLSRDEIRLVDAYRTADDRTRRLVAYALGLAEYMKK